jgi:hypothetical protein
MIEFRAASHSYFKDGKELTSVSRILQDAGLSDYSKVDWDVLERAKLIGDFVHEIARLYALGDLDQSTIDPALSGYAKAVEKFYEDNVKTIVSLEEPICYPAFGYAGTPDLIYYNKSDKLCLDDWKTTANPMPSHQIQLAAYKQAWDKTYPKRKIQERATVILKDDGSYRRIIHRSGNDLHVWMAAVNLYSYKRLNKIKPN